jgi:transposase-like protein
VGKCLEPGADLPPLCQSTEALWGTRVSPGTVSNLNKKIYGQIEAWRHQPIEGEQPYDYLDRAQAHLGRRGAQRLAAGGDLGQRRWLPPDSRHVEGAKEDKAGWSAFLNHLKGRGLRGVELIVSDACMGLVESAAEFFPEARWQRCMVGLLKKFRRSDSVTCRIRNRSRQEMLGRKERGQLELFISGCLRQLYLMIMCWLVLIASSTCHG